MSKIKKPKFPLIAELNDLSNCLNFMGERPLKLIADKVVKQFKETEWNAPQWTFHKSNGDIEERKLFSNPDDTFQFSIASKHSKQDFHMHEKIFEIFVSHSKMEISFVRNKEEEILRVSRGVIIVPPGITHKIKLYGITFVFQSAINGSKVHGDKEIRKTSFLK